jgi:hypothetical protein
MEEIGRAGLGKTCFVSRETFVFGCCPVGSGFGNREWYRGVKLEAWNGTSFRGNGSRNEGPGAL